MVFCHIKKIIFIHIPKTGGTSVEDCLSLRKKKNGYGLVINKYLRKIAMQHYTIQEYNTFFKNTNYYKFSIVRNPYERFISEYYWIPIKNIGYKGGQYIDDFIKYVENIVKNKHYNLTIFHNHFIPQYNYICDIDNNIIIDKLFRYENMDEIKLFLKEKYDVSLPHLNKSKNDKLEFTNLQKDKIYQIYQKDFDIFNYPK
jgi:hypothetical protein